MSNENEPKQSSEAVEILRAQLLMQDMATPALPPISPETFTALEKSKAAVRNESSESTFFEIHRIKRPRVTMMDTEDMTVEQVKRLMDNIPWELNPGNPHFIYNMAHRSKLNELRRSRVVVVTTPDNSQTIARLMKAAEEKPEFEIVEWNPDAAPQPSTDRMDTINRVRQNLIDQVEQMKNDPMAFAAAVMNRNTPLNDSIRAFTERWTNHIRHTSKPQLSQAMYARDIHLIFVKDVRGKKASFVPTNGSMRQKKRRHHAALIMKEVQRGGQVLKGVYPTHIGEMKPQPDGTVRIDVVFEQAQPFDLTVDKDITFAPRGFQNPDGSIDIDSYSIVDKL